MKSFLLSFFLVLSCPALNALAADSLVSNGGFEDGTAGWTVFVPDESKDKNCVFEVASDAPQWGTSCGKLQSDDLARFGIGSTAIPVQPGERYRVSVWVKAAAGAVARPGAPGFVIRLGLRQGNTDADGGHLFIGLGNRVTRNTPADPAATLPTEWKQVEAVVEIPSGVDTLVPAVFSWWTSGAIFVDNFSIEKVDASTAVTPIWQKAGGSPATPASK